MTTEAQLKEWRKYYRQSVRTLPVVFGLTVALCAVLWGLSFWLTIPIWLTSILVGVSVFSIVMEAINILYLRRKLRAAARSGQSL
jgi:hypothetical protein